MRNVTAQDCRQVNEDVLKEEGNVGTDRDGRHTAGSGFGLETRSTSAWEEHHSCTASHCSTQMLGKWKETSFRMRADKFMDMVLQCDY